MHETDRARARNRDLLHRQGRTALHPEIHYKKPHFQYTLYQDCGFLYLSLQCIALRPRYAVSGTDLRHAATRSEGMPTCAASRRQLRYLPTRSPLLTLHMVLRTRQY
eukprot:230284-Rhodomonas_salina.1